MTTAIRSADRICSALQGEILSGAVAAGQRLPSERMLSGRFGVTRNVVREALTRLAQLGLVDTRRGSGSWVTDFDTRARLGVLASLIDRSASDEDASDIVADIMEFRIGYGASLAECAAIHASVSQRLALRHEAERLTIAPTLTTWTACERQWMATMVDATDNRVFRMLHNSFGRAFPAARHMRNLMTTEQAWVAQASR